MSETFNFLTQDELDNKYVTHNYLNDQEYLKLNDISFSLDKANKSANKPHVFQFHKGYMPLGAKPYHVYHSNFIKFKVNMYNTRLYNDDIINIPENIKQRIIKNNLMLVKVINNLDYHLQSDNDFCNNIKTGDITFEQDINDMSKITYNSGRDPWNDGIEIKKSLTLCFMLSNNKYTDLNRGGGTSLIMRGI